LNHVFGQRDTDGDRQGARFPKRDGQRRRSCDRLDGRGVRRPNRNRACVDAGCTISVDGGRDVHGNAVGGPRSRTRTGQPAFFSPGNGRGEGADDGVNRLLRCRGQDQIAARRGDT